MIGENTTLIIHIAAVIANTCIIARGLMIEYY